MCNGEGGNMLELMYNFMCPLHTESGIELRIWTFSGLDDIFKCCHPPSFLPPPLFSSPPPPHTHTHTHTHIHTHTHPCSDDASGMLWHSGPVIERLSSRELATKSGTVYRLEGPLDHAALTGVGINDRKITQSFKNGFPKNWLHLIEKHAMEGKEWVGRCVSWGQRAL